MHLPSPVTATRRFIMQKARRHTIKGAPTACRRTVSGTISLRCARCFSPFPHGTGSLSVSCEYLALADGPAGFTQDFSCPALLRILLRFKWLRVPAYHRLRRNFPEPSTHHQSCDVAVLQPRSCLATSAVWALPRSLATTGGIIFYFLFLRVLRCFSSPRSPSALSGMTGLQPAGFSHSDICGSRVVCTYPQLFAAYHVLHRLQEPRHPPYALSYLLSPPEGGVCWKPRILF